MIVEPIEEVRRKPGICKDCPFGLKEYLFGGRIHVVKECIHYSPTRRVCYTPRKKNKIKILEGE